jgi:hypothetical protein
MIGTVLKIFFEGGHKNTKISHKTLSKDLPQINSIKKNDFTTRLIFTVLRSRSRIFYLYGDVTITGEGLQNSGLFSALRALEQGGIFIVQHLLGHKASVLLVLLEGQSHSVASYDIQGMLRTYSNPDPHG